jgi:DNA-binding transcriptional MerR regulator
VNGDVPAIRVAERARISYRQLDHWTRLNYLRTAARLPGQGHPRMYPPSEVQVALVIAALVHAGVELRPAARAARLAIVKPAEGPDPATFATMLDTIAVFGYLP